MTTSSPSMTLSIPTTSSYTTTTVHDCEIAHLQSVMSERLARKNEEYLRKYQTFIVIFSLPRTLAKILFRLFFFFPLLVPLPVRPFPLSAASSNGVNRKPPVLFSFCWLFLFHDA